MDFFRTEKYDKDFLKPNRMGPNSMMILEELLEARLLIEPRLIDLAVLRATPADIVRLQNILEQMRMQMQDQSTSALAES